MCMFSYISIPRKGDNRGNERNLLFPLVMKTTFITRNANSIWPQAAGHALWSGACAESSRQLFP